MTEEDIARAAAISGGQDFLNSIQVVTGEDMEDVVGALTELTPASQEKIADWMGRYSRANNDAHARIVETIHTQAQRGEHEANRLIGLGTGQSIASGNGAPLVQWGGNQNGSPFLFTNGMIIKSIVVASSALAQIYQWIVNAGSFTVGDDLVSPVANDVAMDVFDVRSTTDRFVADFYGQVAMELAPRTPVAMPVSVRHTSNSSQIFPGFMFSVYDPRKCSEIEHPTSSKWASALAEFRYDADTIMAYVKELAEAERARILPQRTSLIASGRPGIVLGPRKPVSPAEAVRQKLAANSVKTANGLVASLAKYRK